MILARGAGPTQPGKQEIFPELGMPNSRKPDERGDFIVTANVKFPATLSEKSKSLLRLAFEASARIEMREAVA